MRRFCNFILIAFALISKLSQALESSSGVSAAANYKTDVTRNLSGGAFQKTGFLGSLQIASDFDFDTLIGAKGLEANFTFLGNHGDKPTTFIGDAQKSSNIEAPSTFKLYKAYLTENFSEMFNLSLGLLTLSDDFYNCETLNAFRNYSFGTGASLAQTGIHGPAIFPNSSVAVIARYKSTDANMSGIFSLGIFNAVTGNAYQPYGTHLNWNDSHGYLVMAQAKFGVTSLGIWSYTKEQAPVDTSLLPSVNAGFYIMGEHHITSKVSVALRYGIANPRVNKYMGSAEAGITLNGFHTSRPHDKIGFGVSTAFAAPDYRKQKSLTTSETNLELLYLIQFNKYVSLAPNFQYIFHPGLNKSFANANVISTRLELNDSFLE